MFRAIIRIATRDPSHSCLGSVADGKFFDLTMLCGKLAPVKGEVYGRTIVNYKCTFRGAIADHPIDQPTFKQSRNFGHETKAMMLSTEVAPPAWVLVPISLAALGVCGVGIPRYMGAI